MGMKLNLSCMQMKIQKIQLGVKQLFSTQKGMTTRYKRNMHYMHHFCPFRYTSRVVVLLLDGYVVRVPACSSQMGAEGVEVWQCCHSEAP